MPVLLIKTILMKKISIILLLSIPLWLLAQQEGKITYKETISFKVELTEEMKQYAHLIPQEDVKMKELRFDESQSVYEASKMAAEDEEVPFGEGGGMSTVIFMGGGSGKTYINTEENLLLEAQDMMGQAFLIKGTLPKMNWKVLNEQKEILGHMCMKAEQTRDSITYTAWFAPSIPVPVGPATWQGLPGAILEVSMMAKESSTITTATEIVFEEVSDSITRPKKGKKVDSETFKKILDEKMKELHEEREVGGGNVIFKIDKN